MDIKKTYTDEQQSAIERAVSILEQKSHKIVLLTGAGGMGKTTTVGEIVHSLLRQGKRVLLTAPTNKAVRVIRAATLEALSHYGDVSLDALAFATIHKSLGLATLPVEDTKYTAQKGLPILGDYDALVVDEISMVGRKALTKYLLPEMAAVGIPGLFVGDAHQLPPVKEVVSPAFEMFMKDASMLTKPMRQTDSSGVYRLASSLRKSIDHESAFNFSEENFAADDVVISAGPKFRQSIIEHFKKCSDTTRSRVLAWRNTTVDTHNERVRQALYGRDALPYVVGERVVVGEPILRNRSVVLSTDEECVVASVDPDATLMDEDTGEYYHVVRLALQPCENPAGGTAATVVVNVLHELEMRRHEKTLKHYADTKNWNRFWAFKTLFDDIRYTYCITVHRSQGSTYEHAFVDADDLLRNTKPTERRRLLYVAVTRPRVQLVLNKLKFIA